MAQQLLKSVNLKLYFEAGLDENNNPIIKTKTFQRIRSNASVDELYQAATAIGSLSSHPLWNVEKNETYELGE